jgi:hypothetical protein
VGGLEQSSVIIYCNKYYANRIKMILFCLLLILYYRSGKVHTMKKNTQPKTRNHVAIAAQMRNSAGSHDGSKRSQNRRDRQGTKVSLRSLYY